MKLVTAFCFILISIILDDCTSLMSRWLSIKRKLHLQDISDPHARSDDITSIEHSGIVTTSQRVSTLIENLRIPMKRLESIEKILAQPQTEFVALSPSDTKTILCAIIFQRDSNDQWLKQIITILDNTKQLTSDLIYVAMRTAIRRKAVMESYTILKEVDKRCKHLVVDMETVDLAVGLLCRSHMIAQAWEILKIFHVKKWQQGGNKVTLHAEEGSYRTLIANAGATGQCQLMVEILCALTLSKIKYNLRERTEDFAEARLDNPHGFYLSAESAPLIATARRNNRLPKEDMYLTALQHCAFNGDYVSAEQVFCLYEKVYGIVEVQAYSFLLAAYASSMLETKPIASSLVHSSSKSAPAKLQRVIEYLQSSNLDSAPAIANLILQSFALSGDLRSAIVYINRLFEYNRIPGVASMLSLTKLVCDESDPVLAKDLVELHRRSGYVPSLRLAQLAQLHDSALVTGSSEITSGIIVSNVTWPQHSLASQPTARATSGSAVPAQSASTPSAKSHNYTTQIPDHLLNATHSSDNNSIDVLPEPTNTPSLRSISVTVGSATWNVSGMIDALSQKESPNVVDMTPLLKFRKSWKNSMIASQFGSPHFPEPVRGELPALPDLKSPDSTAKQAFKATQPKYAPLANGSLGNTSLVCGCDSGLSYANCCQPLHLGFPTFASGNPIQVMRARYTAVMYSLMDYVIDSTHPSHFQYTRYLESSTSAAAARTKWATDLQNVAGDCRKLEFTELEITNATNTVKIPLKDLSEEEVQRAGDLCDHADVIRELLTFRVHIAEPVSSPVAPRSTERSLDKCVVLEERGVFEKYPLDKLPLRIGGQGPGDGGLGLSKSLPTTSGSAEPASSTTADFSIISNAASGNGLDKLGWFVRRSIVKQVPSDELEAPIGSSPQPDDQTPESPKEEWSNSVTPTISSDLIPSIPENNATSDLTVNNSISVAIDVPTLRVIRVKVDLKRSVITTDCITAEGLNVTKSKQIIKVEDDKTSDEEYGKAGLMGVRKDFATLSAPLRSFLIIWGRLMLQIQSKKMSVDRNAMILLEDRLMVLVRDTKVLTPQDREVITALRNIAAGGKISKISSTKGDTYLGPAKGFGSKAAQPQNDPSVPRAGFPPPPMDLPGNGDPDAYAFSLALGVQILDWRTFVEDKAFKIDPTEALKEHKQLIDELDDYCVKPIDRDVIDCVKKDSVQITELLEKIAADPTQRRPRSLAEAISQFAVDDLKKAVLPSPVYRLRGLAPGEFLGLIQKCYDEQAWSEMLALFHALGEAWDFPVNPSNDAVSNVNQKSSSNSETIEPSWGTSALEELVDLMLSMPYPIVKQAGLIRVHPNQPNKLIEFKCGTQSLRLLGDLPIVIGTKIVPDIIEDFVSANEIDKMQTFVRQLGKQRVTLPTRQVYLILEQQAKKGDSPRKMIDTFDAFFPHLREECPDSRAVSSLVRSLLLLYNSALQEAADEQSHHAGTIKQPNSTSSGGGKGLQHDLATSSSSNSNSTAAVQVISALGLSYVNQLVPHLQELRWHHRSASTIFGTIGRMVKLATVGGDLDLAVRLFCLVPPVERRYMPSVILAKQVYEQGLVHCSLRLLPDLASPRAASGRASSSANDTQYVSETVQPLTKAAITSLPPETVGFAIANLAKSGLWENALQLLPLFAATQALERKVIPWGSTYLLYAAAQGGRGDIASTILSTAEENNRTSSDLDYNLALMAYLRPRLALPRTAEAIVTGTLSPEQAVPPSGFTENDAAVEPSSPISSVESLEGPIRTDQRGGDFRPTRILKEGLIIEGLDGFLGILQEMQYYGKAHAIHPLVLRALEEAFPHCAAEGDEQTEETARDGIVARDSFALNIETRSVESSMQKMEILSNVLLPPSPLSLADISPGDSRGVCSTGTMTSQEVDSSTVQLTEFTIMPSPRQVAARRTMDKIVFLLGSLISSARSSAVGALPSASTDNRPPPNPDDDDEGNERKYSLHQEMDALTQSDLISRLDVDRVLTSRAAQQLKLLGESRAELRRRKDLRTENSGEPDRIDDKSDGLLDGWEWVDESLEDGSIGDSSVKRQSTKRANLLRNVQKMERQKVLNLPKRKA